MTAQTLPFINAILNSIATVLLVTGFILIRKKNHRGHGWVMATALLVSTAFLVCYLAHKQMYGNRSLERFYPDIPGFWKHLYLWVILTPHLLLAIGMLPFILAGLAAAYKRQWAKHRAVNRVIIWVWLYVSITGVIIYYLLYHHFPLLQQTANPSFIPPTL
jgi:uncharacterized membrane protein YozB (DUF420 family)